MLKLVIGLTNSRLYKIVYKACSKTIKNRFFVDLHFRNKTNLNSPIFLFNLAFKFFMLLNVKACTLTKKLFLLAFPSTTN